MDTEAFKAAYAASRNGTNHFVRHPLVRVFHYSDGVQECAKAGCYWLLDILATELPKFMAKRPDQYICVVVVTAAGGTAEILGELEDGDTKPYKRHIEITDMPDGKWTFYVTDDGDGVYRCILPTEY